MTARGGGSEEEEEDRGRAGKKQPRHLKNAVYTPKGFCLHMAFSGFFATLKHTTRSECNLSPPHGCF